MTQELYRRYWDPFHEAGLIYPPVREVKDYNGQEVLGIAYAQYDDTASTRKKRLREWVEALPGMKIKVLAFYAGHQDLFDAATRIQGLQALISGWGSIKTVESVADCKSLVALNIASKPSITGVHCVNQLPQLKVLGIVNAREVYDLAFLSSMTSLEELDICGSMWANQKVDSLCPLVNLKNLRSLFLLDTRISRDGLRPLHQLKNLENLVCSFYYPASEFAALREALPSLKYGTVFDERIKNYPRLASS